MKVLKYLSLIIMIAILSSCSEPSMEQDARSAADLSRISIECARNNDLEGAGKAYTESQAIMEKYKDQGKFEEFYDIYNSYLLESARQEDMEMVSEHSSNQ